MNRFLMRTALATMLLIPSLATAQDFDLGYDAYEAGDYATALRELLPLAEQGDAREQYSLGRMYSSGNGVPPDYAEAVRWYRLAAEQGNAGAQHLLGFMYHMGHGVAQDYAEARRWYRLAAEQGRAFAQHLLGDMYRNGVGVAQDYVAAHMWLNIAAANGFEYARQARNELAALMTPSDISEAQRRARVCMESGYQDCD